MRRISESRRLALVRIAQKRERRRVRLLRQHRSGPLPPKRHDGYADGERLASGFVVAQAPTSLGFGSELAGSLRYLERVRTEALGGTHGVFVDLSRCKKIDPVLALILSAEIERCRGLRFQSVNGRDPRAAAPRTLLRAMGFHKALGIGGRRPPSDGIIEIRSGGSGADVAKEMEDVAAVAEHAFRSRALANRVQAALGEAMLNVSMHAYDRDFFDPSTALEGRWWVTGVADRENAEVIFAAYDQGVGIATTAPKTMGEDLMRFLDGALGLIGLGRADAGDHHIIEAAIKSRRTRTGKPQHGKGLTSMIQLVERAQSGSVWISSGTGQYVFSKPSDPSRAPMDEAIPLPYNLPGTLILWRLAGPQDVTSVV